jgi:Ser/Thr protein kinase RdoA (MazF antagonist)
MVEVVAGESRYALKVYRPGVRSSDDVQWEVDLHRHLMSAGAPVARLLEGSAGYIETVDIDGDPRMAVLSEWARGSKPPPTEATYRLLGEAAGQIHAAVDDFVSARPGRVSTLDTEVEDQLVLLRPALEDIGRWDDAEGVGDVLRRFVTDDLERGICHNDLTLDNIHIDGDRIVVFDFDSAGEHWRASEPQGLYHYSVLTDGPWWTSWLAGYSRIRQMSEVDQRAVPYFVLVHQLENTAWKLGLTPTSVGAQIRAADLHERIDQWLAWSASQCAP